jgi:adenylate cyclase
MASKPVHRIQRPWFSGASVAAVTAGIGLLLFLFPIGSALTRLSYDLPFVARGDLAANEVAVLYLDEASHLELKQPMNAPWDRSLHARLVDQLTAAGAKAIVFDILFTDPSPDRGTEADARLARAIKESGRVILGGNLLQPETMPGVEGRGEEFPYEPFRSGAAAWGNVNLVPDPDYGVRRHFDNLENFAGQTNIPWLPWAVAKFVKPAAVADAPPGRKRYLNYYGPPGTLTGISYFQALLPEGVPPGFFKDKIVFVGAKLSADFTGKGKDEFLTPYSHWRKGFAPGVELHATAALNLLQRQWLVRVPFPLELTLLLVVAGLAGLGLTRCQPLKATALAILAMAAIAAAAHALAWYQLTWFAWLIPILEVALALFCAIVLNSLKLYVEKRLLEESLVAHLSPKLVKRLLQDPALRQVGGSQQQVSIIFSDIASFSRISESMSSDDLVRLMNKYFDATLQCIHETDGTVVKLIGDAIFAIWNAPVEQKDHRERACRTALLLREKVVEFNAAHLNLPLRTRVGLHAGDACVGNIGSSNRFDYTALGDNINLTSRLEGLNKFLGTSVLVTREVQRAVEDSLVWRLVGHFQFKGLGRLVEVFELVGPLEQMEPTRAWRDQFALALQEFRQRRFDSAAQHFQRTIELRRQVEPEIRVGTVMVTADGPSRFYLDAIDQMRVTPPPRDWLGEIELNEK